MKKCLFILSVFFFASCTSSVDEPNREVETQTHSISQSEVLEIPLGGMPVEGGVGISKEPNHAAMSEINHEDSGLVYSYKAEPGFTGTDYVEITRNNSDGAKIYSTTITAITITVTE